ncbi:hypothetical protein H2201_002211 [Coniosporium apollinis]|uniref:Homeobox and C2H2 transcription factor n=1 Tax=Coniosporium apollinis TaxID=61459 RepID=A0ABQ9P115_9PEZI|nr:hypothetical protein H2201_002211 [Coniosporium apollinis]
METNDMTAFFNFNEASLPDLSEAIPDFVVPESLIPPTSGSCPSHPGIHDCLCHGFMIDSHISGPTLGNHKDAEFNNDFSSWIPRYSKPEQACDYCRSRQLECFKTFEGQKSCSPCNALFRSCSFDEAQQPEKRQRGLLDTLDHVPENECRELGGLTGIKSLRSLGHTLGTDDGDWGSRKSGVRFTLPQLKALKSWMDEHRDNPYPTEEEKEELRNRTGLKAVQISNWLANARRRNKSKRSSRCASPSLGPSTSSLNATSTAIDVPRDLRVGPSGKCWEVMNPLERWQVSPPENEAAPLTAIVNAVRGAASPPESATRSTHNRHNHDSESSGCFSNAASLFRAPSTTSLEERQSSHSTGSLGSFGSAWSHGSRGSFNSFGSFGSSQRERRRRRRRPAARPVQKTPQDASRIFQCTFCTDTFKSKYDWSRHEKSLHLSLEKWICAPLGDVITCVETGRKKCVFCDVLDPSPEHLQNHNHDACEEKGLDARTFYRKDHLRQHLRLMHGCKMTESMESWKAEVTTIDSRCGFCGQTFTKWQDRNDHLAKEFRNGAKMKDWKGCRGLPPQVAALVTSAMPPYLIGEESTSVEPFSASNPASNLAAMGNHHQLVGNGDCPADSGQGSSITSPADAKLQSADSLILPNRPNQTISTCWEILTIRLGRFAQEQLARGAPVSDDMLQREARLILYDSDDSWNQTAADNPEWLTLFKKAHGLDNSTSQNIDKRDVLEDLGMLGDFDLDELYGAGKKWSPSKETIPEQACFVNGAECLPFLANQGGVHAAWGPLSERLHTNLRTQLLTTAAPSLDRVNAITDGFTAASSLATRLRSSPGTDENGIVAVCTTDTRLTSNGSSPMQLHHTALMDVGHLDAMDCMTDTGFLTTYMHF